MIPKKILVAFDGSDSAQKAFHYALATAHKVGASLLVFAVIEIPEPATMVETDAVLETGKEKFEHQFHACRMAAKPLGVPLETHVAVGHPADQIIRTAKDQNADLIVLGHRGLSRIGEWLLGSVSKRVASYASCPVTIVR